jgi:hypothetical protein
MIFSLTGMVMGRPPMIPLLLILAGVQSDSADDRFSRMTALYVDACIAIFPDDKGVEEMMAARNARPLTPDEVKIALDDASGRGWAIADGDATAMLSIEQSPHHACSVRWPMSAYLTGHEDEERS